MASSQLEVQTPQGACGMTVCLSTKARVIAHAALKYKSGYITVSRYSDDQGKWRNVHIAKKSLDKLMPESGRLLQALKNKELYQVQFTKKQLMMTTKFSKPGRETLHFISILHPKTEQENVDANTVFNHAKTINLNLEEYEKLHCSLEKLLEVVKTPRATPDNEALDIEERETVLGYRWTMLAQGKRSNSIFLTKQDCEKNVDSYIWDLPIQLKQSQRDVEYEIHTVSVPMPTKIEIIEHVTYNETLRLTGYSDIELSVEPPPMEDVTRAMDKLRKSEIVQITATVASMLGHKRLYFLSDIYDIFLYTAGLQKVKDTMIKHVVSPSCKLFARLLDSCYYNVVKPDPQNEADASSQAKFPPMCVEDIEV